MPEAAGAPVPHEPLVGNSEPKQQQQQKQPKQKQQQQQGKKADKKDKKGGAVTELNPPPEWFAERIKIFDEHMAKYNEFVAKQERSPITITLPDGKQIEGKAWETTPMDVAKGISTSLADRIVIAKVDNQELWDLTRPLEKSVSLALLDFDSPENDYEARQVFWHSSAHVMGEACERSFEGCCLGYGPPLPEGGFFYDMNLANEKTIGPEDYKQIEEISKKAVKEKQKFERLSLPKEVLLEMFKVGWVCSAASMESFSCLE
jgi:threonyl-tRNA synthetase